MKYQFFLLAVASKHSSDDPSLCVLDAADGLSVTALSHIYIAKNCSLNIVFSEICLIKGMVKITLMRGLRFLMINIKNRVFSGCLPVL